MKRKHIALTLLVLLSIGTAIGVYAGTVGVNNLFGFDNIMADLEFYRGGVNYTQFIASRYGSDQSLNTTDGVTFAGVTSGEYFLNAVNKTDIFAYPQQDYSYAVFTDGTNYYAKNGTTGIIDYTETDYVDVMQLIHTALPVTGGEITHSNGLYVTTHDFLVTKNNITISGEGWGTTIQAKDQPPISQLTANVLIGATEIPVNSTVGYEIGEFIVIDYPLGDLRYIQDINATHLTLTVGLSAGFNLGDVVASVMNQFYVTGNGFTIRDIKLDGNNANWPRIAEDCGATYELNYFDGDDLLVSHVEITNSRHRPLRGRGLRTIIDNSYFHDMSIGGGVHIEGVAGSEFNHVLVADSSFIMPSGISATASPFISSFGDDLRVSNCYFFGGMTLRVTDNSIVSNCVFEPNDDSAHPVSIQGSSNVVYIGNVFNGEKLRLLDTTIGPTTYNTSQVEFSGNQFNKDATIVGVAGIDTISIVNNIFSNVTGINTVDFAAATDVSMIGNTYYNCGETGAVICNKFTDVEGLNFVDNTQYNSSPNQFITSSYINIHNNIIDSPRQYAYRFVSSERIIITGNQIINSGSRGFSFEAQVVDSNTPVIIRDNLIDATTPLLVSGPWDNIDLPKLTLSFVDGTLISSDAPFGWEIDANTEYALATGVLPFDINRVYRWRIYATANITEADGMELDILGYGAAPNQPYTQETVSVASKGSETTNFAQNDVVYWILVVADDADIEDMFGGDQIMIKVLHAAADGANSETDAIFTCIVIEWI